MNPSISRQIIEEIDKLRVRAQAIALHNLDQLELDPAWAIQDKAIYCLMVASEERKRTEKEN